MLGVVVFSSRGRLVCYLGGGGFVITREVPVLCKGRGSDHNAPRSGAM